MDFSPFTNLWFNLELYVSVSELKDTIHRVEDILDQERINNEVKLRKFTFKTEPYPLKYVIIDLECDPPTVFGLILHNRLYQLFITDLQYIDPFYRLIWKLLNILSAYYIFTFSTHEARFFTKILPFKLFNHDKPTHSFTTLKIINIQTRLSEGLVPALYSIGEDSVDDPLLRNSKKINFHFEQGHFGLILEHNKSCLTSTQKIVQKRYLKQHLI